MDSKDIWESVKSSEPSAGFEGRVRDRISAHRRHVRRRGTLAALTVVVLLAGGVGAWLTPPESGSPSRPMESAQIALNNTAAIPGEEILIDAAELYFAEDTYLDDMIEAALGGEDPAGEEIQSYKQGRQFHELV